jgi:hypothetical protein
MVRNVTVGRFVAACLTIVFLIPCLRGVSPAMMRGMSTEELTRRSEAVVEGQVTDLRSEWSRDGKTIITIVTVAVSRVDRGDAVPKEVEVEQPGGEAGGVVLAVSDTPKFRKSEKVLLFLKKGKSRKGGTAFVLVGKAQGKYTLDGDGMARKSGFSVADNASAVDGSLPIEKLREKIRGVK